MEAHAESPVQELVNQDRAPGEADAVLGCRELQLEPEEDEGVVVADGALVLRGEQQLEVDPGERGEGPLGVEGLHREALVEAWDEGRVEVGVGGLVGLDSGETQFLGEPPLDGSEGPLATPACLRRPRQDVADAERREDASHLPVLLLVRIFPGLARPAEVAAPIRVELAEAPEAYQHVFQRHQRRQGALLLDEASEEDLPVRVVQHDDQILVRYALDPGVGRGVQVQQHPHHRPSVPLAPVLPAPRRTLHEPPHLQDVLRPGVGELEPVLPGQELVEVPDREVRVHVPLQPAHLLDHRRSDSTRALPVESAVPQSRDPEPLVALPHPPHLPRAHPQDVRRLQPVDLPLHRLLDDVLPGHGRRDLT